MFLEGKKINDCLDDLIVMLYDKQDSSYRDRVTKEQYKSNFNPPEQLEIGEDPISTAIYKTMQYKYITGNSNENFDLYFNTLLEFDRDSAVDIKDRQFVQEKIQRLKQELENFKTVLTSDGDLKNNTFL